MSHECLHRNLAPVQKENKNTVSGVRSSSPNQLLIQRTAPALLDRPSHRCGPQCRNGLTETAGSLYSHSKTTAGDFPENGEEPLNGVLFKALHLILRRQNDSTSQRREEKGIKLSSRSSHPAGRNSLRRMSGQKRRISTILGRGL
jgi:hypothetical protein